MALIRIRIARAHLRLGLLGAVVLMGVVAPVRASTTPPPPGAIAQAQQQLSQAQLNAKANDSALGQAQAILAASEAQLSALNGQISALDKKIDDTNAKLELLQRQVVMDRQLLSDYMLQSLTRQRGTLEYLMSAGSLSDMLNRQANVQAFASAGDNLAFRLSDEQRQATAALAQLTDSRNKLRITQAQAAAANDVVAAQEEQVAVADAAAHNTLKQSQRVVQGLLTAQQLASQPPPKKGGTVFPPSGGSTFSIDTDLTKPSGLTADEINQFLSGTALAGLGGAFMSAEQQYHVSARYFVAHAILESAWGTSAIARDKHNLFGYGADDANPYGDAVTFASFADCINTVARKVQVYYLTPGGAFYHGPTLRGMNVAYASDPNWSVKIATIANRIP